MMDFRPLTGTCVLDLTREAAGHACARILGQLGAEVSRGQPGALFRLERGTCDLVLSDLRRTELDGIGWTPSNVAVAPSVVSITPFGLDGPAARGDATLASGWLGPRAATALTAAHAATVGLAALRYSGLTGERLTTEVATHDVVATSLGNALPPAVCPLPPQSGSGRSRITVAPCADGFVGLAAPTPLDRAHLSALTGVSGVAAEEADLGALLAEWLSSRTRLEVFSEAQLWRIPIVPVLTEKEALGDEHAVASPFRVTSPPPSPSPVEGEGILPRPITPLWRVRVGEGDHGLPLSDIRVLDLGMVWAGPYCGRLLASLGADVIKVEGPALRDGTRPPDQWAGCAGLYADLNRGKKSLVVDLAAEEGHRAFLRVAAHVDVVLDNFSPRVMPNLGLDHASLARINPSIVTLSMPAFRSDGPWGAFVAYGSGLELMSGLARRGSDDRPGPAPIPYLDYLSGAYGAVAILAALIARDKSSPECDCGGHVEVAQHEVARQLYTEGVRCLSDEGSAFDPISVAHDPHLIARKLLPAGDAATCEHSLRMPWIMHGVAPAVERGAPGFGDDSREILARAGITRTEIEEMIRTRVVVADDDAEAGELGAQ